MFCAYKNPCYRGLAIAINLQCTQSSIAWLRAHALCVSVYIGYIITMVQHKHTHTPTHLYKCYVVLFYVCRWHGGLMANRKTSNLNFLCHVTNWCVIWCNKMLLGQSIQCIFVSKPQRSVGRPGQSNCFCCCSSLPEIYVYIVHEFLVSFLRRFFILLSLSLLLLCLFRYYDFQYYFLFSFSFSSSSTRWLSTAIVHDCSSYDEAFEDINWRQRMLLNNMNTEHPSIPVPFHGLFVGLCVKNTKKNWNWLCLMGFHVAGEDAVKRETHR